MAMNDSSLDELIRNLPERTAPLRDKLRGHDALFLLETRQGRRLFIRLRDGQVHLSDEESSAPDCTVRADESALTDLICGRLSPAKALLLRRVTISGNPAPLMGLIALL